MAIDNENIDAEEDEALSGKEKAAMFLLSLGEDISTKVFSRLENREIRLLAEEMEKIEKIPRAILGIIANDFINKFESETSFVVQGSTFAKSVMSKALDDNKIEAIYQELLDKKEVMPFAWTKDLNSRAITQHLSREHPQTVSMIMAYLPPEVSASVMMTMPEHKQGDIALRIINIGEISDLMIHEVDETLKKDLAILGKGRAIAGGVDVIVDILNSVDKATEENILDTIEEVDGELAAKVRNKMFVFEDLVRLDDKGMQELLRTLENQQLTYSLKTASESMKQKIFSNLSVRAAEMLEEELNMMGPIRLSEVEEAQQSIIKAAKELENTGTIVLGGKGGEDILV